MKNKYIQAVLQISFVIFFLYVLASVDLAQLVEQITQFTFSFWLFVLLLFLLTYIAKAFRFKILNPDTSLARLTYVTVFHNFFLMLLPFRLGEVSYITQRKSDGVAITKSITDIVIVRLYDVIVLSLLFLILILSFPGIAGSTVIILLVLGFSVAGYILVAPRHFRTVVESLIRPIRKWRAKRSILEVITQFAIQSYRKRLILLMLSVLVWFFSFAPWVVIFTKILEISATDALIATSISLIASFIPIHPPGGVGTVEAGWIAGFLLVGVSYSEAATTSVFAHAILVVSVSLFAFLAFISRRVYHLIYV